MIGIAPIVEISTFSFAMNETSVILRELSLSKVDFTQLFTYFSLTSTMMKIV